VLKSDESPWFPRFRQYREQPDGDWNEAISHLAEDLRKVKLQGASAMEISSVNAANTPEHKKNENVIKSASFNLDWGSYAALRLVSSYEFETVLDIGSGAGEHKRFFEFLGKKVFSVDIVKSADYVGDFLEIELDKKFDVVWCSHVLEHQRNIGIFLDKIFDVLADDGILAISVPIHPRERLISGHLSSWSIPLLCYNLIMAGFNCRDAKIFSLFELSLIVRKDLAQHKELRKSSAHGADAGYEFQDIAEYFPFKPNQGTEIKGTGEINWGNPMEYIISKPTVNSFKDIKITSKNFTYPNLIPKIIFRAD
jgi:SAM-dependent methyltransferase